MNVPSDIISSGGLMSFKELKSVYNLPGSSFHFYLQLRTATRTYGVPWTNNLSTHTVEEIITSNRGSVSTSSRSVCTCRQFIITCQFTSNVQLSQYATDAAKIAYLANLLEGPPLSFFNALFEQNSSLDQSYTAFSAELKRIYDHPIQGQNTGQWLMKLQQGRQSICDFVNLFQGLAVKCGWKSSALTTAFRNNNELVLHWEFLSLDEAINSAITIADQIFLWQGENSSAQALSFS